MGGIKVGDWCAGAGLVCRQSIAYAADPSENLKYRKRLQQHKSVEEAARRDRERGI